MFGALTFAEPPDADPHVRWCEREAGRPVSLLDGTPSMGVD